MLKVRLKRLGRKKYPTYRVVLMVDRSGRNGKPIEELGYYNPITKASYINLERLKIRLKQGAKPTKTVYNLFVKSNLIT
uniref:Ribosomal protein S16 n=1 Tax=Olisthodiscus luteus TaxID=83000 RepID=A0A7U0QGD1_OLILU|nr:ribosomal protein S16 [Olisthodiscus luteus]QQW50560.1 ribosomal protein S16 [Olisthodiscus luteus]